MVRGGGGRFAPFRSLRGLAGGDGAAERPARPVPWENALEAFLARAAGTPLRWWLYGSAARALRGEPADPGDIDVHVDEALLAGSIFDDLLVTPVERMEGWVAPWTGRAFDHAIIKWIADPPFRPPALEVVRWRGYEVPVVAGG